MGILISDATPVQFWRPDCDTWNESSPEGLHHHKFCLPWNCDDRINIEFTDLLSDDTGLVTIPFPSLSEFENTLINLPVGTEIPWTLGAAPSVSLAAGENSYLLREAYSFVDGIRYKMTFNITNTSALVSTMSIGIYDAAFNLINSTVFSLNSAGTFNRVHDFIANDDAVYVGIIVITPTGVDITANSVSVQNPSPDEFHLSIYDEVDAEIKVLDFSSATIGNGLYGLYTLSFVPSDQGICDEEVYFKIFKSTGTPDTEVAKSDAMDIKTAHLETVLITYSNHRNFAGIYYQSLSPDQEFTIRIPAVFNKQRLPQESESLQLSSNRIISLNSQTKVQKLLSTGRMPDYMHLKILLILQHQFVYIHDQYWVKEETYERIESTTRDSLEKYTCWLTKKEYVVRNIL